MDLPCFEFGTVHSKLRGISLSKYKNGAAISIEPGLTVQMFRLALLYSGVKG
jgi:hypothetical protein